MAIARPAHAARPPDFLLYAAAHASSLLRRLGYAAPYPTLFPDSAMPPKASTNSEVPQKVPESKRFQLDFKNLPKSYAKLMNGIRQTIKEILKAENEALPECERIPERVNGKLYTPKDGTFAIEILGGEKIGLHGNLVLLSRFKDLYFEAFYTQETWYQFNDAESDLPPASQFPYNARDGVKRLPFASNYAGAGGAAVLLGPDGFAHSLVNLSKARSLCKTAKGLASLQQGPLAAPMVGISEALRFPELEKWNKDVLANPNIRYVAVPPDLRQYFNYWGDFSRAIWAS
ncbi:hypothetical protein ACP4OV_021205 [Aristida adscensionis]